LTFIGSSTIKKAKLFVMNFNVYNPLIDQHFSTLW